MICLVLGCSDARGAKTAEEHWTADAGSECRPLPYAVTPATEGGSYRITGWGNELICAAITAGASLRPPARTNFLRMAEDLADLWTANGCGCFEVIVPPSDEAQGGSRRDSLTVVLLPPDGGFRHGDVADVGYVIRSSLFLAECGNLLEVGVQVRQPENETGQLGSKPLTDLLGVDCALQLY